jgi:hypothetical protein
MTRNQYAPPSPPSTSTLTLRRISSVPVGILLYTSALPFTPTSWIIGDIEGAFLVDRLVAGLALLSALYFQWCIAGLSYPVAITFPNFLASSDAYISNGRMSGSKAKSDIAFHYHPVNYWPYLAVEIGALLVAEFGHMEYVRRIIVLSIVAGLWAIGWTITPRGTKLWAWGHVKAFWFWIVLDLLRDVGFGGGRHRRRR